MAAASVPAFSQVGAQAVWTNADDRDYSGNPPVFVGAFWSYGYVAPDQNGNGGHIGNWSGNLAPGKGGPLDAYLGAPGDTLCDVNVTLNSLTIASGGALTMNFSSALAVTTTNLASDGTIALGGGGGSFPSYTNTGTLTKTAGTGTSAFDPDITFNSTPGSTVATKSGTLQLSGDDGVLDTVAFVPAAGTLINLVGGTSSSAGVNLFQGTLSNGTGTGTVLLSAGTMAGTQRSAVTNQTDCTLAFTGDVFQWTGGILGSYQQGAVFTNTGVVNVVGDNLPTVYAIFTNASSLIVTGGGNLVIGGSNSGGSITNAATGTFDLQSDAGIGWGGGNGNSFTNVGLLKKSAGTGTSAFASNLVFNNQGGTIEVDSGTLQLSGGNGTSTGGTFNVPTAGAVLDLIDANDNTIFTGTFTGSGAGTVRLSQAALYSNNSTGVTFNFPGTLFQWTGGLMGPYQGGHVFINAGTINLSGVNEKDTYGVFTNNALVTQSGAGAFNIGSSNSGGSFTNAAGGTYDLQTDANIGQSGYAFNNAGLFKKSGGTGTSTLTVSFNNQGGTVEVDSGTLQLPVNIGDSTSTGGVYNVASGAVLDLGDGGHFTGTYTGSGGGTIQISQGTLYTDNQSGATFNFPGSVFQWTGGTLGGYQAGQIFVNAGTLTLSGDNTKQSFDTFTNTGTMIQTGAGFFEIGSGNSGGSFTNAAGASYNLQSDAAIGQSGYPFYNKGFFQKSAGTGSSVMGCALTNTGTIAVYSGTLEFASNENDFSSGNTLDEGTWNIYDGATLLFDNNTTINTNQADIILSGPNSSFPPINKLTDNQGSFSLLGLRQFTTAGALSNEGDLVLGAGCTLHVAGAFTASGTDSSLSVTIGGTASSGATSPGILQVSGTATLAGNLALTFASSATLPTETDTLTILSATSPVVGSFANAANGTRVNTGDGKGSFLVSYGPGSPTPNAVTLSQFLLPGQSALPVVSLSVTTASANANEGVDGAFLLTRIGDASQDIHVNLQIKGTAVNGADYTLLKTSKKIKAGHTSKPITVIPVDESYYAGGKKTVKIVVLPGQGYTVGGTTTAKVKIFYDR